MLATFSRFFRFPRICAFEATLYVSSAHSQLSNEPLEAYHERPPESGESSLRAALDLLEKPSYRPELSAYAALLRECGSLGALSAGRRVHEHILRNRGAGRFLRNLLIEMYGKCGSLKDACAVFDTIVQQNAFSWTILISAYAQNGHCRDAIRLFRRMNLEGVQPMDATFTCVLAACSSLEALAEGRAIHARISASLANPDVILGTALVSMYAKCGSLEEARCVFEGLSLRSAVTWNAMIAAYARNGHNKEALELYKGMGTLKPNEATFITVLDACASLQLLDEGKLIHERIVALGYESDLQAANSVVNMYGKCGSLDDARLVFDAMSRKSVVSWTAMISAYAQHGHGRDALKLYLRMAQEGVEPNEVTFVGILDACGSLTALAEGKAIHDRVTATGYEANLAVASSLLNMYGKCGCLDEAHSVFVNMRHTNFFSWASMATAYALHGHARKALGLYREMDLEGIQPNGITFITILSLCSHGGLLDEGRDNFVSMIEDHGITPMVDHYDCMIDLLGRTGRLKDAEDLIVSLPMWSSIVGWTSILGSSKMHGNVEGGARAAYHASEMDPNTVAPHVMLSNIYANQ